MYFVKKKLLKQFVALELKGCWDPHLNVTEIKGKTINFGGFTIRPYSSCLNVSST